MAKVVSSVRLVRHGHKGELGTASTVLGGLALQPVLRVHEIFAQAPAIFARCWIGLRNQNKNCAS